jgi:predicted transcriptional regulator
MSESTFTLRVDTALKKAFTDLAGKQDRSAAQLIREFMRDVVQKAHSQDAYAQWFARKVAEGRADIRLGRVADNETVTDEAATRRQRLLARLGDGRQ